MDGGRKKERGRQTGGKEEEGGDTLTLISLYFVFCIPGCALSLLSLSLSLSCLLFLSHTPFLPFLAFTPLGISCIQRAWVFACRLVCGLHRTP